MINNLTVNYIDVIILLPLVYGAYKGFSQGLIVEMSTLFALVLGVFYLVEICRERGGLLERFRGFAGIIRLLHRFRRDFSAGYYRDASAWEIVDQVD